MKRTGLVFIVLLLIFTGCAPGTVPSSSESSGDVIVVAPSSEIPVDLPPENPPANSLLPGDVPSEPEPDNTPDVSSSSDSAAIQPAAPSSQNSDPEPVASEPQLPESSSEPAPSSEAISSSEAASSDGAANHEIPDSQSVSGTAVSGEMRAVWFSYLEFLTIAQNKSETQFTSNIATTFNQIADAGFNSVWVQVRPFGDALYDSDIFPHSYVLTGTEGQSPGYDPLAIMVREAHLRGLTIEAWINPYRVRSGASDKALCSTNPALQHLNSGSDAVIKHGNIISYNPSSQAARNLIVDGVVEIVQNYNVDGIHFDDYFYPTTDLAFDSQYYNAYRSAGGTLSQENWRRDNVNKLIAEVYAAIKRTNSSVQFGVSPQANMSNNYNGQYVDVNHWLSNIGYVDYICPQVYFGFKNQTLPFSQTVRDWSALITNGHTKLYIGIAAYKIGGEDKYAGTGAQEWITDRDILSRMVADTRDCSYCHGFSMYRYDFLFSSASGGGSQMGGEMNALKELLKD